MKGSEDMDIDVPDTERDALPPAPLALSSQQRAGKKQRVEKAVFLRGHSGPVFLCAWNPHITGMLATGAGDGTARIWDTRTTTSLTPGAEAIVLRHDTGAAGAAARTDVTAIAWNAQGTLLATASFAGQLRIWSTQGELKQTLGSRQVPIIALRWNRKGSLLLSGCLDGTLALWDVANSGLLRHEYRAHTGSVLDVDWLDNTTFASCASDRNISIWHDGTPTPTRTLVGHTGDVNALRWHPSGKYLASGSDDGSLKIWTLNSDTPLQDFVGHAQQVYAVRWMPRSDKVVVASASFDGTVRVWDVLAGTCLRVLAAHTEAVHCLAFSSDGRYLATGSFDKRVRVWSIKDGTLFKSFVADDGIHDVQWAPKGRIAVAIANSQVALFDPLAPSA
ncbi:hypothetical protein LPJ66_001777 [Kickxella alabastrina]|uniref:Uncharacterized protein n=1 Tax=Kickxella alabastrina TaxID=61397 RepID=A0ACC1ISC3_9FUNG|nr:hypothetical protein LPJ66_001777 [Kickxella alabastrina]